MVLMNALTSDEYMHYVLFEIDKTKLKINMIIRTLQETLRISPRMHLGSEDLPEPTMPTTAASLPPRIPRLIQRITSFLAYVSSSSHVTCNSARPPRHGSTCRHATG
jgi:hypothetical protein